MTSRRPFVHGRGRSGLGTRAERKLSPLTPSCPGTPEGHYLRRHQQPGQAAHAAGPSASAICRAYSVSLITVGTLMVPENADGPPCHISAAAILVSSWMGGGDAQDLGN